MILAFSPFRLRCAFEASRWPQDGPRELQEGPKRPPRRPQERPRAPQERPKSVPRGYLDGPRGGTEREDPPSFHRHPPRQPQEALQGSQEAPKRAPRGPQEGPKTPPPRAPRGPQDPPIELPEDHPPLLAHFGSLYVSLLAMSRQLSWAELLNGLAGLREASTICNRYTDRGRLVLTIRLSLETISDSTYDKKF